MVTKILTTILLFLIIKLVKIVTNTDTLRWLNWAKDKLRTQPQHFWKYACKLEKEWTFRRPIKITDSFSHSFYSVV
jgi:hypothetical protein